MHELEGAGSTATLGAVEACAGWTVCSREGRLGFVEEVLLEDEMLSVRRGLFHVTHELVTFDEVLRLDAERRLLVVRG
jgi:hypothetical protein